jgi:uncharacterized protein (TIGR02145 family)
MKRIFCLLALALNVAFATHTVAILPSDGTLSDDEEELLTDKMRQAALKVLPVNQFTLLKQDVVIKRLGGMDSYMKECSETSCIVSLGEKAQVDYVAQCRVGKLGNNLRITVELYEVSTGGLLGMFSDIAKDFYKLLPLMEKNVPDVFKNITAKKQEAPAVEPAVLAKESTVPSNSKTGSSVSLGNKTYKTVVIGSQTWMAENLNYGAEGSKCYENKPYYCVKYGRLYNWETAKKVCPFGWHLPSKAEWEKLSNYVERNSGCSKCDATKLKATNGWNRGGNGTDGYGFSALPGGVGLANGNFRNVGNSGGWWSNSSDWLQYYTRYMNVNNDRAIWGSNIKSNLYSVRCIKD